VTATARERLRSGAPDPVSLLPAPIPYDTSLDARATARAIGAQPPSLTDLLARFRDERATLRGLPVPGL
jgi:hypothetical protein